MKTKLIALVVLAVTSFTANAGKLDFPASVSCSDLVNGNPVNIIISKNGRVNMLLFIDGRAPVNTPFKKPLKEKSGVYGTVETFGLDKAMLKITPNEDGKGANVQMLLTSDGVSVGEHNTDNCQIVKKSTDDSMKDFE